MDIVILIARMKISIYIILLLIAPFSISNNATRIAVESQCHFNVHSHNGSSQCLQRTSNQSNTFDTNHIKQSNWYPTITEDIKKQEYNIQSLGRNTFSSFNVKQLLQSRYSFNHFILQPVGGDGGPWKLDLEIKGIYNGKKKIYSPVPSADLSVDSNRVEFSYDGKFIAEYINNQAGIQQNFIIKKMPASCKRYISLRIDVNKGWLINKVHDKEIHFAKKINGKWKNEIVYNNLKVWDAKHKTVKSNFSVSGNEISINVVTADLVYPVTIDPLSSTPNTTINGSQTTEQFGFCVASAGDVNGDGYSDVVVGTNLDRFYEFLGSPTGLSSTPALVVNYPISPEHFGLSVASAGDVNGDGYSDVIVGSNPFGGPVGHAYIFLGSNSGLSAIPSTVLTGTVSDGRFGFCVASAGDINGDGYSDVIVSEPQGSLVQIFLGSIAGLVSTPSQTIYGVGSDDFGHTVSSAGDVNGDGYSDILIGAPGTSGQKGAAYLYLGSASGLILSNSISDINNSNNDYFGNGISCIGDVNGDGYSDIMISAYGTSSYKGSVYLYFGSATGINSTPTITINGNSTGDEFGYKLVCAGDVNGDGYSDILIGAMGTSSFTGNAYLYYGSPTGISASPSITLSGTSGGSYFSYSLASCGDINGDGFSDIIVGAPFLAPSSTGAVYIYHGSPDGLSNTPVNTYNGTNSNDFFGLVVSSAGDVNGDGYSDVIVTAEKPLSGPGIVYIYLGSSSGLSLSPSATLTGFFSGDGFGYSASCAGDVNGDGYSDIVVGAPGVLGNRGAAYIYLGGSSGLSSTPSTIINDVNNVAADEFGCSVNCAGDVNGDGYADVIIGAYGVSTGVGAAYLFLGGNTGIPTSPSKILNGTNGQFGICVASAGDVNGDGYCDVIIGANVFSSGNGAAYVYLGSALGLSSSPSTTLNAVAASSSFGTVVAPAGDVNGDGYCDIIIGAVSTSPSSTGAAYVFLGSPLGIPTSPSITLTGILTSSSFGYVAGAGDVNGDGYSDVIVGAPNSNSNKGAAYLYLGSPSGTLTSYSKSWSGNNPGEYFGYSVSSAGDVNGDGYSDILIGAYGVSPSFTGSAKYYFGIGGNGKRNNLQLYNADLITPIQQANFYEPNLFGAGLYAKSFLGKFKGKLVWQTVKNGNAFTGSPISNSTAYTSQQSSYTNLGLSGTELKNQVPKQLATKVTYIRARIRYDLVTAITGQVFGPWRYPEAFNRGRRDLGAVVLPLRFLSFTASPVNRTVVLNWTTANENLNGLFEVQYSIDGIHFITLTTLSPNGQLNNTYQWTHNNVANGKNYYRIKYSELGNQNYSATRIVSVAIGTRITLYPNPVKRGGKIFIESLESIPSDAVVSFINNEGKKVYSEQYSSLGISVKFAIPGTYRICIFNKRGQLMYNQSVLVK